MADETRLRAVVVDDEAPARALLREYLGAHADVEVVAECSNGFEAVKTIDRVVPDLAFLDIQMPKLDGFEVLELLEHPPAVVFVTAYDEFAIRAFEVHAVDYVLKPIARERLAEALARVRERLGAERAAGVPGGAPAAPHTPAVVPSSLAAAARPPGQFLERVLIRDGANVHVVPIEQVEWVEAQDDYISIRAAGQSHLKSQSLAELSEAVDPARFVRIHRSFLLNVERLARLELLAKDQRVAILKDGKTLPVSRTGFARLKELL